MPTRVTIAEDGAAGDPAASGPPEGTAARPITSGSTLDLFTPKASASSPTPRFGLTRQAAKTLSSRHVGGGSGTRPIEPPSSSPAQYRDIVASPRLLGYLLNFIASLICMVSAIKFERLSHQQYWFDLLVYFSDGRIDQNLTNPANLNPDSEMNRSEVRTRLLFATNEEQQDLVQGPVASNIYEASMLYDVAMIVGGPEPRLFNPYRVRLLQDVIASNTTESPTSGSTLPTSNPSASFITQTPTSLLDEAETTTPSVGPTMLSDLSTDAPTKGMEESVAGTSAPTMVDASSLAPTEEKDIATNSPTSVPTVANLTAILPIIDEKSRPIRAVDYWVSCRVAYFTNISMQRNYMAKTAITLLIFFLAFVDDLHTQEHVCLFLEQSRAENESGIHSPRNWLLRHFPHHCCSL